MKSWLHELREQCFCFVNGLVLASCILRSFGRLGFFFFRWLKEWKYDLLALWERFVGIRWPTPQPDQKFTSNQTICHLRQQVLSRSRLVTPTLWLVKSSFHGGGWQVCYFTTLLPLGRPANDLHWQPSTPLDHVNYVCFSKLVCLFSDCMSSMQAFASTCACAWWSCATV